MRKIREIIGAARDLLQDTRDAKQDGQIDEAEAVILVQDSFHLIGLIVGKVTLTKSVKALIKTMATELLRVVKGEVVMYTDLDLAKEAYSAYGAVTDYKNYQGLPMPKWDDLTPKIQAAWLAAAQRVAELGVRE
jgi:hypothetical protein